MGGGIKILFLRPFYARNIDRLLIGGIGKRGLTPIHESRHSRMQIELPLSAQSPH